MGESYLERERKLDVPADFAFPQLGDGRAQTHELRAVYYDTDDALLQARGVTLRRRTGGDDDGWHLKVPDAEGRLELRAGPESSRPPRDLLQVSRGLRFDQPLRPRQVVTTTREAHPVCSDDGQLVAEVADDRVTALVSATGKRLQWREVEIELGPAGSEQSMERLAAQLRDAGATPATTGSKYARAVGEPSRPGLGDLAAVVDAYLQAQYVGLAFGDLRMRRGENAVHKTRVAVRRVRSTLRIFGDLFDEDRAARLDGELMWYAAVLGVVRDLDVAGRHLREDLDDLPELVSRRAADGLLACVESEREQSWRRLLVVLDGRRYGALLRELAAWRRDTPWTTKVEDDPRRVQAFVTQARKKSDKRLRQAEHADAGAVDEAFHRARKAAKRTRYAAELARPVVGKKAKKIAREHEKRQGDLGVRQDHRMLAALLQQVAARESLAPDVAFACGVLAQRHDAALHPAR